MPKFLKELAERIFTKGTYQPGALEPQQSDPFTIWGEKKRIPSAKSLEAYNGLVYACTRAICEEIANMQYIVKRSQRDGTEQIVENHDIVDALEGFNTGTTGYDAKYKTAAHLELCGNAYWYLEGVKNELGKPSAMYILNPGRVKVVFEKGVFPHKVAHYEYREDTAKYVFQPYEILHFKYPDPNDDDLGVGTVQSIAQWIDADNYANETNRRYFLNGARIGGFLESEASLTPAQMDYLKKSFEAIHKGVDSAYKTAALPKGVKYTPASTTAKDMDFTNLSQTMLGRILAGFRVPKSVLGISEDVNRANAEAGSYIFALRTIKPKMQQIVAHLNEFFVPRYGSDIWLDFEDPVPENTALRVQQMQAATGNKPIMTQNEAREEYFGLEAVEGGDTIAPSISPNAFPISPEAPKPTPSDTPEDEVKGIRPAAKKKAKRTTRPKTRAYRRAEKRVEIRDAFADAVKKSLEDQQKKLEEVKTKSVQDLTDADWSVLWKAFVTRTEAYEKKLSVALAKQFEKQKKTVQSNLASSVKGFVYKAIDKSKLMNREGEIQATIDAVSPIYEELYAAEGQAAAALLDQSVDLLSSDAYKAALKRSIALMSESYTDTTLDQLSKILDAGLQSGASMADLKESVASTFDDWSEWRASSIAHTETFRTANQATKDAWKETGVVKSIRWYTAEDEKVCEFCGPQDGTVISIDSDFYAKGDTITGSEGGTLSVDYSDVGAPPLHVNCRCYSRPEETSFSE